MKALQTTRKGKRTKVRSKMTARDQSVFVNSSALFTSNKTEYITPKALYDELNQKYKFTLDPCTRSDNPLGTEKFYTVKDNGLAKDWEGERVYINPPYSNAI